MRNIIILGGNGYVGRELTAQWLSHDPRAEFYIVSRSGKGAVDNPRVHSIKANARDVAAVESQLPKDTEYTCIVDLVGDVTNMARNVQAARSALALARRHDIPEIGYVAGCVGPARFRHTKRSITEHLERSNRKVVVANPSVIYGGGRNDAYVKAVPALSALGHVFPRLMPRTVDDVAHELVMELSTM